MNERVSQPWVVVDIGNTSMKFGVCPPLAGNGQRTIGRTLRLDTIDGKLDELASILPAGTCRWLVASVNRLGTKRLKEWLVEKRPGDESRWLANAEVPLACDVEAPERVGVDRLLAAFAVNGLRTRERAAIIVGSGTAITIDLLTADGVFRGGAIFPGLELMARALHDRTDALPLVDAAQGVPTLPGRNTTAALQGALYWGIRGALAAIIEQLQVRAGGEAEIFFSNLNAAYLSPLAREEKFLVLRGLLAIVQDEPRV